jgi:hypothetical protein
VLPLHYSPVMIWVNYTEATAFARKFNTKPAILFAYCLLAASGIPEQDVETLAERKAVAGA